MSKLSRAESPLQERVNQLTDANQRLYEAATNASGVALLYERALNRINELDNDDYESDTDMLMHIASIVSTALSAAGRDEI